MEYIDTHCHLNDDQLYPDREGAVERARKNGCLAFFNAADSFSSFGRIFSLAKEFPGFCYPVIGIHPEYASLPEEEFEKALQTIEENKKNIKAIGEIGLDYHYSKDPEIKEKQKDRFLRQIRLAKKLSLPIVIHSRDADQDCYDILKEELPDKADIHCYGQSYEMLKNYLRLPIQLKIGIGGVVTFKNGRVLKEVVEKAPLSVLLTETDSPYLSPVPNRGKRNEPSYIPFVLKEIALLRKEEEEETAKAILKNGEEFYGL